MACFLSILSADCVSAPQFFNNASCVGVGIVGRSVGLPLGFETGMSQQLSDGLPFHFVEIFMVPRGVIVLCATSIKKCKLPQNRKWIVINIHVDINGHQTVTLVMP